MNPKINTRRARVNLSGYSASQMANLGDVLTDSMKDRFARAEDAYDRPLPPLTPKYALQKGRKHPPAIRNMMKTGETILRGGMGVLSANENRVKVGLRSERAIQRFNLQPYSVWGASPRNKADYLKAFAEGPPIVSIQKIA